MDMDMTKHGRGYIYKYAYLLLNICVTLQTYKYV